MRSSSILPVACSLFALSLFGAGCGGATARDDAAVNPQPDVGTTCTGALSATQIASAGKGPGSIVASADDVYYTSGNNPTTLFQVPANGGNAVTLYTTDTGRAVAADDSAVYVVTGAGNSNGFGLVQVPKDGSAAIPLVSDSTGITAVTIDDAYAYYSFDGELGDCSTTCQGPSGTSRVPKGGGTSTTVSTAVASYLNVDDTSLYIGSQVPDATGGGTGAFLWSVPKSGGTLTALASDTDAILDAFTTDASYVYFTRSSATDTSPTVVQRVPKSGGAATTVSQVPAISVTTLVVSSGSIFWLDDSANALLSAPVGGGDYSVAAPGAESNSASLAAAGNSVFWISGTCGSGSACDNDVMRLGPSCP